MIRRALTLLQRRFARLRADARGNVLILTALALVPLTFAVGFSIDYTRAMKLRTRMNAAADAAALAAVNVAMMQQSDSAATAAARAMFNAQVSGLPGMIYDTANPANPTVTIVSSGGVNIGRKVTVSYTAQSRNLFGGVLGKATLTINGSVTADATRAPHVDFYLLMDTSPSMLLPSTTTGLNSISHGDRLRVRLPYPEPAIGRDLCAQCGRPRHLARHGERELVPGERDRQHVYLLHQRHAIPQIKRAIRRQLLAHPQFFFDIVRRQQHHLADRRRGSGGPATDPVRDQLCRRQPRDVPLADVHL
ncbi:TadE/TadG family type IV pilus assembly protein [Novosphingobium colocasiae]